MNAKARSMGAGDATIGERSDVATALARGALYRLVSLATAYPTSDVARELRDDDASRGFRAAARTVGSAAEGEEGSREGNGALERAVDHCLHRFAACSDPSDAYARTFGHTVHGSVPAYELEYGTAPGFLGPHEISDLAGIYHAHGLRPAEGEHERADHVSLEAEFLAFLACKEAYAAQCGDAEGLARGREIQRSFLADHFARWTLAFARRIESAEEPYASVGGVVRALVQREASRLEVEVGGEDLEILQPGEEERECFQCPFSPQDEPEAGVSAPGTERPR